MGETSKISWTRSTFNPFWGCVKVSPGCDHCYADSLATRYGHNVWRPDAPRRFFGDKHWAEPLKWNRDAEKSGEPWRVFCGSMCDWAEGRPDQAEARTRLFDLIERTPALTWLLLTKRPGAIRHLIPAHWLTQPRHNVWYGTSVENQEYADKRIPQLLNVPATVRFLSCEPLLGPVDLERYLIKRQMHRPVTGGFIPSLAEPLFENDERVIQWVITGDESGHGARPTDEDWVRSLRDQCQESGVAFFYKQRMAGRTKIETPELDGRRWIDIPTIEVQA